LLREIVKFRTYIDSLRAAQTAKEEFYAKRAKQEELAIKGRLSPVDSGRPQPAGEERDRTPRSESVG